MDKRWRIIGHRLGDLSEWGKPMTYDQGWNAALDFLAEWLKEALISEQEVGDEGVRAAWTEVLNICRSERKDAPSVDTAGKP